MNKEYENIINEYMNNFEKSIPKDEPEKNELMVAFRRYLNILLEVILEGNIEQKNNKEEIIRKKIDFVVNDLKNMDIISIKKELKMDEALEDIRTKSGTFFVLARSRLNGETIKEELNQEKEQHEMEELLKKVRPYNKKEAQQLVSEGILDLNYAINPNSDVTSLRLGHIINYQNAERKNEER